MAHPPGDGGDDSLLKASASAPAAVPPDAASLVGRTVRHFRVLRRIGAGGMGVVYEAQDEKLDRRVALKVLSRADDAEARARFVREARAASRVTHPHVAVVYEAGDEGDVAFNHEGEIESASRCLELSPAATSCARRDGVLHLSVLSLSGRPPDLETRPHFFRDGATGSTDDRWACRDNGTAGSCRRRRLEGKRRRPWPTEPTTAASRSSRRPRGKSASPRTRSKAATSPRPSPRNRRGWSPSRTRR
jgi:hypothetical protein